MSNQTPTNTQKPSEPLLDFNRAASKSYGLKKLAEMREKLGLKKQGSS